MELRLALLLAYWLLFAGIDEIRFLGIGSGGSRLLLLDLLVAGVLTRALTLNWDNVRIGLKRLDSWALVLFAGAVVFSLMRGVYENGGFAVGEARWYLLSVLLPISIGVYSEKTGKMIKRLIYLAAIIHTARIFVAVVSGESRGEEIERYLGGRESLVIAMAILFLVGSIVDLRKQHRSVAKPMLGLLIFASSIIINQTRSIFLFLPIVILIYLNLVAQLSLWRFVKAAFAIALVAAVVVFLVFSVVPLDLQRSILTSVSILSEIVSPATYQVLIDPVGSTYFFQREFSTAGNTVFRLLAWSQVVSDVFSHPGGWLVGLPMGRPFYFVDTMGGEYENLDPHNDYISMFSKIGFLGLLGYLMIVRSYFVEGWKEQKLYLLSGVSSNIHLWLSQSMLILLFSLTNAEMRTYGAYFLIWIFMGCVLAEMSLQQRLVSKRV